MTITHIFRRMTYTKDTRSSRRVSSDFHETFYPHEFQEQSHPIRSAQNNFYFIDFLRNKLSEWSIYYKEL